MVVRVLDIPAEQPGRVSYTSLAARMTCPPRAPVGKQRRRDSCTGSATSNGGPATGRAALSAPPTWPGLPA